MIRLILILLFFSMSFAQTIGTTSDGKTVIINEDGTWEIVEEDYSLLLENERKYTETTIDYFKVWKESSFKKDLGHIILTDGSIEFPLVEYDEYFNYFC